MVRFWRGQGREHHRTGAGTLRIRQPALPLGTDSGAGTNVRPVSFSFGGQPLSKPSFQQLEVVPLSSRPIVLSAAEGDKYGTGKKRMQGGALSDRRQTLLYRWFSPTVREATRYATKLFKGCIAPKDITHIRQEQPKETCYLFEGFMDYLSFLTLRLERCPGRPDLDGQDYIVLNSTSNLSKAIRPLGDLRAHPLFPRQRQGGNGSCSGTAGGIRDAHTGRIAHIRRLQRPERFPSWINRTDNRNIRRRSRNRRKANGRQGNRRGKAKVSGCNRTCQRKALKKP